MELYFDTAATTPLLPEVRTVLTQAFDLYGNPSSLHRKGVASEERVDDARKKVLKCMGLRGGRLVFTGCGTEGNNLAIFGVARRFQSRGRHLVTTAIEHPSVLEPFQALEAEGWEVTYIAPEPDGSVLAAKVIEAVRDDTVLVSMMHVNNETGAILPVRDVGQALRDRPKTLFHVDGIQAFGKIPESAKDTFADLYAVSGHKLGAPKGVGALYIREGLTLNPILYGGGQEGGLRSGTENILGIVAMGQAAEAAGRVAEESWSHVSKLADAFIAKLEAIPGCRIQRPQVASPYIISAAFPGLRGEVLVHAFESQGLFVSTGSACSTKGGHATGSHVLKAMNRNVEEVTGTIRFSIGRWHTMEDVLKAADIVAAQIAWLAGLER